MQCSAVIKQAIYLVYCAYLDAFVVVMVVNLHSRSLHIKLDDFIFFPFSYAQLSCNRRSVDKREAVGFVMKDYVFNHF